jgi:D-sedoheptulose 7-phosphate isomerase
MLTIERSTYSPQALISSHLSSVGNVLKEIDLEAVQRVVQLFRDVRDRRGTIYIAANGGSSSTASHWVNDLGKATKRSGCPPIRVMSLSDNVSWFTALANDEGVERVFASGNSPNLIEAVDLANRRMVTTVALLGFDGGALKNLVDEVVLVETAKGSYELVEDAHSVICHAITRCLISDCPETK